MKVSGLHYGGLLKQETAIVPRIPPLRHRIFQGRISTILRVFEIMKSNDPIRFLINSMHAHYVQAWLVALPKSKQFVKMTKRPTGPELIPSSLERTTTTSCPGKRSSMAKPSKHALGEARGRSILDSVKNNQLCIEELLSTKETYSSKLDDKIMADLRVLYPYMRDKSDGNLSFESLVYEFKCAMFPEGEVFWWQQQALTVLHALNLWCHSSCDHERPKPPDVTVLGDPETVEKYLSFRTEQRVKFQNAVYSIRTKPFEFSIDCHDCSLIAEATLQVCDSSKPEALDIEKRAALRFAKVFGAMCCACKSVGKGKMACSRCQNAFYCGRECQKAHWREHKKDCIKKEDGTSAKTM